MSTQVCAQLSSCSRFATYASTVKNIHQSTKEIINVYVKAPTIEYLACTYDPTHMIGSAHLLYSLEGLHTHPA